MPKGFPRPRTLLLILAVFVWFGSSVQPRDSGARKQLAANPRALLTNPLLGLAALVDRDGDDRLYYNYAQLMVGETPDLEYLSTKEQGDPRTARTRLEAAITPGPGLRLPYRDFPVEYPPVPLALMLLPRLLVASYYPYRMVFGGFIAALFLLTAWLGARLAAAASVPGSPSTEVVWRRLGWLLLAIGPILCQRFDILPAALVAAALAALAHRRDWLAGVAVGLAILTKLYPLLIVFPLAAFLVGAGQWRRVARAAVACTLTMAAVAAPFLITAPEAFLRSNALYGARPFHFESTWGSLLLALRGPATLVSSFGSLNVISPGWLLQLAGLVLAAGLLALAIVAGQRGRALAAASPTEQTAASLAFTFASLLFVLATSKVLSPQFFIWLIPLAALLPGASGRRIYLFALAVAGLTQIFYPPLYGLARKGSPIAVAVLLLRNGLLVALAVTVMRQARRSGVVAPPDHRPTDAPDAPGPAATARA